jgi:hypothetical protein
MESNTLEVFEAAKLHEPFAVYITIRDIDF